MQKRNAKLPPLSYLIIRLITFAVWLLLAAEMLFLLLPRTVLDLRATRFLFSITDQPTFDGQAFGAGILLVTLSIEAYSLFALWWLALRCSTKTIKEVPVYIWIGAAFSVLSMLNFVLPILWALVAIPLFSTARIMGKLQIASLIVTATAFAVMYWRGKLAQANVPERPADSTTKEHSPKLSKKWQRTLVAALIISIGVVMLIPAKPQPPLTLEQAMNLRFKVSVKEAPFDIPVNYHYNEYSYFKKWPQPKQGGIDKDERRQVDNIKVTGLLPDMAPYTAANAAEFEMPGWGKKVTILFGQEKNLNLDGYISKLVKMDNSNLPGMLQYESLSRDKDEFFSSDHLINITCNNKPSKEGWYPSCEVLRPYRYKQKLGNTDFPVFHLRYHFSRDRLPQWREIDEQVQALFDRFAAEAQRN